MGTTLLTLIGLLFIVVVIALWRGGWRLIISGLRRALGTVRIVWLRLLLGILLGGLIRVLIPGAVITEWMGPASGLQGVLIGSFIGLFMVGGPYTQIPVIAAIYQAGAGAGPVIALLTAGNLISVQMLFAWHFPFFGVRLALARFIACLFVPPVVGLLGGALFQILTAS